MQADTKIAFKEWAVVVDALGHGEQILILRKGGIHESGGRFRVAHNQFWLLPTQFHEAEAAVIPAKHQRLRELATGNRKQISVEYYAVVDCVLRLDREDKIERLAGRHIWTCAILHERFTFGKERGLFVLLTRVYRRESLANIQWHEGYGGCKSWVELDQPVKADSLVPVLTETEFHRQRDQIVASLAT